MEKKGDEKSNRKDEMRTGRIERETRWKMREERNNEKKK